MIVKRDKDIASFDSKNFWEVHTTNQKSRFRNTKGKFDSQEDAPAIVSKTGKTALDHAEEFKNQAAIEILSEFQ